MDSLSSLINDFSKAKGGVLEHIKEERYLLQDTRVKYVTLYDHLILTTGIAVAILKELFLRGVKASYICQSNLSEDELKNLLRLTCLMHDWGKVRNWKAHIEKGEKLIGDWKGHVERGSSLAQEWLKGREVKPIYLNLILSGIEKHHIDRNPQTLFEKIICLADSISSAGDRPELAKAKTWDELEKVSASNLDLEKEIFGREPGLSLIFGDTDKVKSYVFEESSKLPEIRGASQILNDLNTEGIESIFSQYIAPECLIYKGGGSFLGIAPIHLAKELIKEIEKAYLQETKAATISCVKTDSLSYMDFARGVEPYPDEAVLKLEGKGIGEWLLKSHFGQDKENRSKRKNFGELIAFLSSEIRREKGNKDYIPFLEAIPIMRRCQSCGRRGAEHEVFYDEITKVAICDICNRKRRKGHEAKTSFTGEFVRWAKQKEGIEFPEKAPKDLDELAKPYNYIGFLYADGNNIGNLLEKSTSPANYRHISQTLREGIGKALFEALSRTLKDKVKKEALPFEIINIGGDDVTLIIAAPYAWKLSLLFLENFEQEMKGLQNELNLTKPITSSLGLVISKTTYPVYFAEKLATDLLKQAKVKAKERNESALSYIYLTTSIAIESAEEVIKQSYNMDNKYCLTMRPYSLEESKRLWNMAQNLKNLFSSSQQNALAERLGQGALASVNFFLYQIIARVKEEKKGEASKFLEELQNFLKGNSPNFDLSMLFWLPDEKGILRTPIYDLLELIKICRGEIESEI